MRTQFKIWLLHLGADVTRLLGIIGVIRVLTAPVAGRLADRRGAGQVVSIGESAPLLAGMILAGWNSLTGLIFGVVLLISGYRVSTLVAHQQVIYGLRPASTQPGIVCSWSESLLAADWDPAVRYWPGKWLLGYESLDLSLPWHWWPTSATSAPGPFPKQKLSEKLSLEGIRYL